MSEMTPEEFWAILHAPVEIKPIFFRLYHDADGDPICYSMEDLPGNYIEITLEEYHLSSPTVRVVDGKLKEIKLAGLVKKLIPSDHGTLCDPRDICVVTDSQPNTKWSIKTYETN